MNKGSAGAYDIAGAVRIHNSQQERILAMPQGEAHRSRPADMSRSDNNPHVREHFTSSRAAATMRGDDSHPPSAAAYCGFVQYQQQPAPPPYPSQLQQQQQQLPQAFPLDYPATAALPCVGGPELRPTAAGQPQAFAPNLADTAAVAAGTVLAAPFPWDGIAQLQQQRQQQQQQQLDQNDEGRGEDQSSDNGRRGRSESVKMMASAKPSGAAISASKGGQATRKRFCLFPGCLKAVKSQGHCQSHGAVAKRCKILGCPRQAQGKHDGAFIGACVTLRGWV
jgi:hypothetical protein